ncbi:disintegrin and metalloproteinase domain-containing protein 10-like [Halichondria panicea]|uniref:disintegrin and metalloproteinase domain-containing protein 10-like n=1 Tax=Halichondria panicea TaxID=6063 RepID=UPI00312B3A63
MKLYSLLCVALLLGIVQGEALSHFIRHYEPLTYDSESLLWNHHRVRRSMLGERSLELQFTAFGRDFNLLLKPETRFFHKNFTLTIDGQKSSSQLAKIHLYSGVDQISVGGSEHALYQQRVLGGRGVPSLISWY